MNNPPNPNKEIMVCVTGQRSCDRLINRGMARREPNQKMHVVHCVQTGHRFMNRLNEPDAIDYLFTAAQLENANLLMLRTDNVDDALVEFAKEHDVGIIVMGASPDAANSIITRLQRRLPGVEFDVVV